MKWGYVVKGKLLGVDWQSSIYENAQECDNEYSDLIQDNDFSELKRYTVYLRYEEWA